uniref:Polypeptide N-acetylgalactosaminyltransferase n=1 Tax=Anopheles farauti TaxID=69004 RepID=A0A182QBU4_9DIPT
MRPLPYRSTVFRPEFLLLFLLATALVLIVHQYSRATFEQLELRVPKRNGAPHPPAPGHMGEPVTFPQEQKLMPAAVQEQIALGWKRYGYNQFVSDLISVRRQMPDVRDGWCLSDGKVARGAVLPPVSVVIVFHDEALSVLLRTVHSVLNRTPPELIREILLVDDWSSSGKCCPFAILSFAMEYGNPSTVQLKTFLDDYYLPYDDKVRILRTPQRLGLIQGRIFGARRATASYLLFLDAHCECLEGWLEPLLEVVVRMDAGGRKVVAVPTIDWLNETTLALRVGPSSGLYGAFDWNLSFQWRPRYDRHQAQQKNPLEPFDSPVMAGGLFCIEKEFFARLGWYDPGLQVHGGENMELSFKVWMCGGAIKIVPCSHVAHIQKRNHPYIGSYTKERELTMKNSLRVAEVWMDEYAESLYRLHPDYRALLASRTSSNAPKEDDLNERRRLRSQLACRSFHWYLQHVFPEQDDPLQALAMGWIKSEQSSASLCLTWPMRDRSLALVQCHGLGGQQIWFYGPAGQITREGHCLRVDSGPLGSVRNSTAHRWQYLRETGQLKHTASGLCLVPTENRLRVTVEQCQLVDQAAGNHQRWTFQIEKNV